MPRRTTRNVTNIRGTGVIDETQVWRVFECFRPGCDCLMKVTEDWLEARKVNGRRVEVKCRKCGYANTGEVLDRAARWKYCRVCEWLQPLESFHRHKPTGRSFRSGHQLECRVCKNTRINPVLNPKRTSDQHREAGQRRRLYVLLSGESSKIDSRRVFDRFDARCFQCGKELTYTGRGKGRYGLDHTLPAKYLWPLTTANATLLCEDCNNAKHDKWPSQFYKPAQLKRLAVLSGIRFDMLAGPPCLNKDAVRTILANVDSFLQQWIPYPDEIRKIRQLILDFEGIDIYRQAKTVPEFLK